MRLITTRYIKLPKIGRHIVAQFDEEGVIVYQAYRPAIGNFAATHGYFDASRQRQDSGAIWATGRVTRPVGFPRTYNRDKTVGGISVIVEMS